MTESPSSQPVDLAVHQLSALSDSDSDYHYPSNPGGLHWHRPPHRAIHDHEI
jgi:hypothetical protein